MTVSAGSCDPKERQNDTSSAKPSHLANAGQLSDEHSVPASSTPACQKQGSEEPDMALEPDLPSDGRDSVGEAMIRDLPRRPELSEPPSQSDLSSQAYRKQSMVTDPNVPPPEPVQPLSTPPEPGEVQPMPLPMILKASEGWQEA